MRKRARLFLSVLLAVILCICFCACQKGEEKDVTTSDTAIMETSAIKETEAVSKETTAVSAEKTTTAEPEESTKSHNNIFESAQDQKEETEKHTASHSPVYLSEQTTAQESGAEETTSAEKQNETTTVFGNSTSVTDVTEELKHDRELQLLLQLSDPVDYDSTKEMSCIERMQSICVGELAILYSPEKPYSVEEQTIRNETDVTVTTPEKSLEWVAENIYNIKSGVIRKFKKECSKSNGMEFVSENGSGIITFEDGCYTGVRPAASKPVYYCSVVSAQKSKEIYQVRYMLAGYESSKKIYCTAVLKQNKVDGQKYWSVVSVSRETEE